MTLKLSKKLGCHPDPTNVLPMVNAVSVVLATMTSLMNLWRLFEHTWAKASWSE